MATPEDRLGLDWSERTGQSGGQGHYRWSVKTASDPAAAQIRAENPTATTIPQLIAQPVPGPLAGVGATPPGPPRTPGVESTLYTLDAWLLRAHPETDGDYHLVIGDQQGNRMIAEIPDPNQVAHSSPFRARIAAARAAFEARYPHLRQVAGISPPAGTRGRPALVEINERVRLVGIGFFDFVHGQDGVAANGIELHPAVDIAFP